MAELTRNWTFPVVCHHDYNIKKEWYIFFRFYHAGKWHDIKKRGGINRYHDKKERKAEAESFRNAREIWLKNGWNPILDPEFKARHSTPQHNYDELHKMTLVQALEFAFEKHQLAEKSDYDYATTVRNISNAAVLLRLDQLSILSIKMVHIKALMEAANNFTGIYTGKMFSQKKAVKTKIYRKKEIWSEKAYNKNLTFLSALFTELIQWEVLEYNPCYHITRRDERETELYIPPTVEEKTIIREYLHRVNNPFFKFWITLYHTGIRPKEILGLQICDFEEENEIFRLKPFSGKTKTKKERTVAINPHLMKYFKEMQLHKYPNTFYIFSTGFLPGVDRMNRRIATDLWDVLVRGHLGIDKYLYSTKHLGADDLAEAAIEAGIKQDKIEEMVRDNLGHSSKFMVRRYTKKGIQISQNIIKRLAVEL